MGQQKSFIKIKGEVGGLSFYKGKDGYYVREKGGIDASRIEHDPAFQRTRENGMEFGASGKAGKLLRSAARPLLQHAKDGRLVSRLTQVMSRIKNLDTTSARGERSPGMGIATPEGQALLKGFDFNTQSKVDQVLFSAYTADTVTGTISIPAFKPVSDAKWPEGATQVSLTAGMAVVDFVGGSTAFGMSDPTVFELTDTAVQSITLTPKAVPVGTGTTLILLLVEFFQEVNDVSYSLNNGSFNALSIIAIA